MEDLIKDFERIVYANGGKLNDDDVNELRTTFDKLKEDINQEHIKKSRAIVAMLFKHYKHYSRIRCRMYSDDTIETSKTLYNKARRIYLSDDNSKG